MDVKQCLILVKGEDKTESVDSINFLNGWVVVKFADSPRLYRYHAEKVKFYNLQGRINPSDLIISVNGNFLTDVYEILDFGSFYRVFQTGEMPIIYKKEQVKLEKNCLTNQKRADIFNYFKETAEAVSLETEEGFNILSDKYNKIERVSNETVLSHYLDLSENHKERKLPETVIYPFGLNQSQKIAVENALSSQISIIKGPPGTGKTQTILNIIANAVRNGQTVAVVSNNNPATKNVEEKLEKEGLSFFTAFLGKKENKDNFLAKQTVQYPDMSTWVLEPAERLQLKQKVTALSNELNEMFKMKNRIAAIEQELLDLTPEQHYFDEYYSAYGKTPMNDVKGLSSQKLLSLWLEYEQHVKRKSKLGFLKKIFILFRFNPSALKVFYQTPELVIPYLQQQFYVLCQKELTEERAQLEKQLEQYIFDEKMMELSEESLRLFRAELSERYDWRKQRRRFDEDDFHKKSGEFNQEYPVILSTTYSIKGSLSYEHTYDYLIVDEASQVDLATGVLAYSCARNIVIVGDLQQLPNVLKDEDVQICEEIWSRYSLPEIYHFSAHSLLSSAVATWPDVPTVLLKEHYRCHPKIINFCNQKFYGGELIIMTEDHKEPDVLTLISTAPGNHARGYKNQREIDVIVYEVLPRLAKQGYEYENIGIIAPYNEQVDVMKAQLDSNPEVETVHKFQGREKDAIIISTVDNVIGEFVDNPQMLNVAVSRAVKSLTVVTSQNPLNDQTLYGDLARYIKYNNCEVIESSVYSVFDLLYKGYAKQLRIFLKKHKKVSEYNSENILYGVIQEVLENREFSFADCDVHVSLANLVKDYSILTEEEATYARNPLTHVDFLLFRRIDKSPLMAIEVDGASFHAAGSDRAERDKKKNQIFAKCSIPLLRLRTDESREKERIEKMLRSTISMD